MGRGDRRTRKGKIWRGSTGNSRPKQKNIIKPAVDTAKVTAKDTAKDTAEDTKKES